MFVISRHKQQLIDYCEELISKLKEQQELSFKIQKSVQHIIDHLVDCDNDWEKVIQILEKLNNRDSVKKFQNDTTSMNNKELNIYCHEIKSKFTEESILTSNLMQSRDVIVAYLKFDGREALIKFFKIRNIL